MRELAHVIGKSLEKPGHEVRSTGTPGCKELAFPRGTAAMFRRHGSGFVGQSE